MIFPEGSVPVKVAARVYGKDVCWVRAGIIAGWLPIGTATKCGVPVSMDYYKRRERGRINYYISPKALYEHTGYLWDGKKDG